VATTTYQYEVVEGWGFGTDGHVMGGVVPDVTVDSKDNVYLSRREPPAILVYDRDGRYLRTFGDDVLTNPHNIWIDEKERLFCADTDDHTVRIFSLDGELLDTWGTPNQTGAPGQPFNRPTKAMAAPSGEVFVSDGYGQHRVHRFSADGDYQLSWGEEGTGPSQFALPHDLWIDPRERVLVSDRENNRIQLFDLEGTFIEEWTDIQAPNNFGIYEDVIYVAEGPGRVSMFDLDGKLVGRWGEKGDEPGQFADPAHGMCVDSRGDVYVGEVPWKSDRIQKFTRV
jgi:hypothetical protein